jgi:hypothetical protein
MKDMNMNKGMKYAKSTKKGKAGDDMLSMDAKPMKKMGGGTAIQYASGGSVQCRGNGLARGKKTLIR